ncbi:MAG: hypothetical protein ACK5LC_15845 [Coprobacillaceae bacterium]
MNDFLLGNSGMSIIHKLYENINKIQLRIQQLEKNNIVIENNIANYFKQYNGLQEELEIARGKVI